MHPIQLFSISLPLFLLAAFASASPEGAVEPGSETVKKCSLCVAPKCQRYEHYSAAFSMPLTSQDGTKEKRYTYVDETQADMVAMFTTLGGFNTNGSVTITNHIQGEYLISVDYAQLPPPKDEGEKKDPITVDYLVKFNEACYRDMPKGMHTKDVQSVTALVKRS